jgi:2,4-dienoyl-CoA reductase-like NADH-dependent reductase (Old Yellow Enzyme family)
VDLLDISSGGMSPDQQIPLGPGYQVPGAEAVRKACTIAVASVGMITEPHQAQAIVEQGKADLVLLARASMRDPQWPLTAAIALGRPDALRIPPQFDRGWGAFGPLEMDFSLAEPFAPLA